jgi:hypothetical protein
MLRRIALLSLLAALPLLAQTPYSMTPTAGPTAGGTEVTIKGDFGLPSYGVIFGSTPATSTTKVDDHTLLAITPPHLPGTVEVIIFEFDFGINTGLTFDFFGGVPPAFERVLLPVFTPPVRGAFGSEFHTFLRIANSGTDWASIHGLEPVCVLDPCIDIPVHQPYFVRAGDEIQPHAVAYNGGPGRFLWAEKNETVDLSFNLRVHDVTRSQSSFGTEIPVVRENDWTINRIVLLGVPTDPRFRNTLRIYGQNPFIAKITVGDRAPVRIPLSNTTSIFDVPYAAFGDFPIDAGTVRVTIEAESLLSPTIGPIEEPMWAMITVTNNDTQLISTITPQP